MAEPERVEARAALLLGTAVAQAVRLARPAARLARPAVRVA
jgi:hypothetical protein